MDELQTLKLFLSCETLYSKIDTINIFEIQQLIYSKNYDCITIFDPYIWIAKHIQCMLKDLKNIKLISNKSNIPKGIVFDKLSIGYEGDIKNQQLINICYIAFNNSKSLLIKSQYFDPEYYYYIHNEIIDHYFSYKESKLSNIHKSCIFYVNYGIHCNIILTPIYPLVYIASYPQLIGTYETDETLAQQIFFKNGNKIIFDAYMYVASNFEKDNIKDFVNCKGVVDEERAIKHYIRHGYNAKYQHDSFNKWKYLANNPKRINKILKNNSKIIDYDVYKLTGRNIAKDFIKKKYHQQTNKFNEVEFVKKYIDDEIYVNKNKLLSIENAAEYFSKFYVISKHLRFHQTNYYKIISFFHKRAIDSAKQIPYNAARYIVQSHI